MRCCAPWRTAPSSFPPQTTKKKKKTTALPSFLCSCNWPLPRLVLHDSLAAAGIDTSLARGAREGFVREISRTTEETDLARAALYLASEDDSLVSHSSVPLPVEPFLRRLHNLSTGFYSVYGSTGSSPELLLANLDTYFYVDKGFHRTDAMSDTRALYLHSVLTMLKMLRACGILDFDVEIYFPRDLISLPRGFHKQQGKSSNQAHIMTSTSIMLEILRNLKDAFWPFHYDSSKSLFLRAAQAANHIHGLSILGDKFSKSLSNTSGLEIASAKAAQHRIGRGVWTNVRFGDMRRALAACERLILLGVDYKELRDYAVLLYHCGYYQKCWEYITLYQSLQGRATDSPSTQPNELEEEVMEKLTARLTLILAEEGWRTPKTTRSYWGSNNEPW